MAKKNSLTLKPMQMRPVCLKTLGTIYTVTCQRHRDHAESNLLAIILTDLAVVLQEIELYSSSRAKQTNTRLRTLKETVLPAI